MKIEDLPAEPPKRIASIGECAAASILLRETPKFVRENPFSERGAWYFENSEPGDILLARRAYWNDTPLPCKTLVETLRNLKFSVKVHFGSKR